MLLHATSLSLILYTEAKIRLFLNFKNVRVHDRTWHQVYMTAMHPTSTERSVLKS